MGPSGKQVQLHPQQQQKLKQAVAHCAQLVRRHDYEHFLSTMYLPRHLQAPQLILRAFNVETAIAADRASKEKAAALMRLTWWRDCIAELFRDGGRPKEQPVLRAIGGLMQSTRLSQRWFNRVIEARMEELMTETPPNTMEELEGYAESTSSALLYLSLEAADVRSVHADHAASHCGKAEGVSVLLRSTAWHSARRRSHIPIDVASKHGLVHEDLYRGRAAGSPALSEAAFDVASRAHSHLEKLKSLQQSLPAAARPLVVLPAVGVDLFLRELQRRRFDVTDAAFLRGVWGVSPLWLHANLWRCKVMGYKL